jgi:hypothetical protein
MELYYYKEISIILNYIFLPLEVAASMINLKTGLKTQGNISACRTHLTYFLLDTPVLAHYASVTGALLFLCWWDMSGKI